MIPAARPARFERATTGSVDPRQSQQFRWTKPEIGTPAGQLLPALSKRRSRRGMRFVPWSSAASERQTSCLVKLGIGRTGGTS